ncbi:MAG: ATP F0F1 synthase subunit B [Devosiaceae bacterium]|nr:ATP F0F1 synthase subunit B [Devosiaceae bacterium MH13]
MDSSFWALVGLIIFLGLMVYLKVPGMVTRALDARADKVRGELEEARRLREEAQAVLADFRRKTQNAEEEADAILAQAKAEAARMTEETEAALEEMITRRTAAAEARIAQAEAQALGEVRSKAAELAVAASEKVLADQVQGDAAASLIDSAIADVKARIN